MYSNIIKEKEGDLTQSYDKTPYTNRKFEYKNVSYMACIL